jgi:2-amino-4-hydroxy-6-hydroxymethyldihydropteridine diphosphokinase
VAIAARSAWYATAPVPRSNQPDFVNGVARVESDLDPAALLFLLHDVEDAFGRVRAVRNEARVLDLDLIDYEGRVEDGIAGPILPHPRAHERGFVLVPLRDVAPGWRHPVSGEDIDTLIASLPPGHEARRL